MSQAEERIKQLEGLFSVTDENSEIHELNSRGKAKLSEDMERLLESALKMCSGPREPWTSPFILW